MMKKKYLEHQTGLTPDAWSMRRLSHRLSDPAYHIKDCRILSPEVFLTLANYVGIYL